MSEKFKGDALELKISGSAATVFADIAAALSAWYDRAYSSQPLGAIVYDNGLFSLAKAMPRDTFLKNFASIIDVAGYVGSFESYLTIFKNIFGLSSLITFERVAPGNLKIIIVSDRTAFYNWATKLAEPDYIVDQAGNRIVLRQGLGINDYYQVLSITKSLNPGGIYLQVEFSLTGE